MATDPQYEYTVERGDGWVEITRSLPHVTYAKGSRSVHVHYWTDDEAMDRQGYGVTDLVCHGCGLATRFLYPAVSDEQAAKEPFRPMLEAFVHDHREHFALANEMLCPPGYHISETRDLREAQHGD